MGDCKVVCNYNMKKLILVLYIYLPIKMFLKKTVKTNTPKSECVASFAGCYKHN